VHVVVWGDQHHGYYQYPCQVSENVLNERPFTVVTLESKALTRAEAFAELLKLISLKVTVNGFILGPG
jgi:hypothetical protein